VPNLHGACPRLDLVGNSATRFGKDVAALAARHEFD
jgi:hypothetical protein